MFDELVKLLRETVGLRPLLPFLLVALIGLAFLRVRDYPLRELLSDRYFLLAAIAAVAASLAWLVWTSSLAERTPSGRYGIYVARIRNDPDRAIQTRLIEGLQANLAVKAAESGLRIEVRDWQLELGDQDIELLPERARSLNASVVVWGTAMDDRTLYPRLWSGDGKLSRSSVPIKVSDIEALPQLAASAWERIAQMQRVQAGLERQRSTAELAQELAALRAEFADLRERLDARAPAAAQPPRLGAVLVGIGNYGGQADLAGPGNDVAGLAAALRARDGYWKVRTLLDRPRAEIESTIEAAAAAPADEILLVFLSGHIDPGPGGDYWFYMSDLKDHIDVKELIEATLARHPKTVFLIDGRFDPKLVDAALLARGAVLSAEAQGMAYESLAGGKPQGAFTRIVIEALESAAESGAALPLSAVHARLKRKLAQQFDQARPRMTAGKEAPTL